MPEFIEVELTLGERDYILAASRRERAAGWVRKCRSALDDALKKLGDANNEMANARNRFLREHGAVG